jgi:hypothetical protein
VSGREQAHAVRHLGSRVLFRPVPDDPEYVIPARAIGAKKCASACLKSSV